MWPPAGPVLPTGPTADAYRIAGYVDGLIGAARPDCDLLRPHYDSGLKWPDKNNPQPDDPLWDAGVAGGVRGTAPSIATSPGTPPAANCSGAPTSSPAPAPATRTATGSTSVPAGAHLANDDPPQILTGAATRLYYDTVAGHWKLVIEATMFVTGAR